MSPAYSKTGHGSGATDVTGENRPHSHELSYAGDRRNLDREAAHKSRSVDKAARLLGADCSRLHDPSQHQQIGPKEGLGLRNESTPSVPIVRSLLPVVDLETSQIRNVELCVETLGELVTLLAREDVGPVEADRGELARLLLPTVIRVAANMMKEENLGDEALLRRIVSILLDIVRQMSEEQYAIVVRALEAEAGGSAGLVSDALALLQALLVRPVFRAHWADMLLVQHYVMLHALRLLSITICNRLQAVDDTDAEGTAAAHATCREWFTTCASLAASRPLQLEALGAARRARVAAACGDVRRAAAALLREMWFALGELRDKERDRDAPDLLYRPCFSCRFVDIRRRTRVTDIAKRIRVELTVRAERFWSGDLGSTDDLIKAAGSRWMQAASNQGNCRSMGDHKRSFIPCLVGPFLEVSFLCDEEVRNTTIPLFFDMMQTEYNHSVSTEENSDNNLKDLESELIDKIDVLVERGSGDVAWRARFVSLCGALCNAASGGLKVEALTLVAAAARQLDTLLQYRAAALKSAISHRMLLTTKVLNFYKQIDRPHMYIRYIHKLCEMHRSCQQWAEAGLALRLHATLLSWRASPLAAPPAAPAAATERDLKRRAGAETARHAAELARLAARRAASRARRRHRADLKRRAGAETARHAAELARLAARRAASRARRRHRAGPQGGLALRLHATLLSWRASPLAAPPAAPAAATERDLKEILYLEVADLLNQGHQWEIAVEVVKELVSVYEEEALGYGPLAELHSQLASLYTSMMRTVRSHPGYFRVVYYGRGFPDHLRGEHGFVYRGNEYEQLADFKERLLDEWPDAEVLPKLDPPGEEITDSDGQCILLHRTQPACPLGQELALRFKQNREVASATPRRIVPSLRSQ
ncbi:hypothetical protein MSG28_014350 [Choristoneura fumiferana]|uniref:Uncharacterized protein n=1 Tax=Choristoneura fumiferana TaxID=7141 RepID=A0ACC0JGQ1_CHOFU|nr:hypothetical protein MSG28_014350 [Choristoneura fumiferana]